MRFANPTILQMAEDAKVESRKAWDRTQSDIDARETPAVKFNPDNLIDTFELPKATPSQQNERDSYLLNNLGSGVAMAPAAAQGLNLLHKGLKAYGQFQLGSKLLNGGKVTSTTLDGETAPQSDTPLDQFSRLILRNDYQ